MPGSNQLLLIPANEVLRLLREDWPTAKMLAEEIFAILYSGVKNKTQDGTVNLTSPPGVPALVINGSDDGGIVINGPGGQITISVGGITLPGGIGPPAQIQTGGGGIPGKIISGGPGATYTVNLYEKGLSQGVTKTVSVQQMQIDPTETIPANTWATVALSPGGTYSMQVPVWVA